MALSKTAAESLRGKLKEWGLGPLVYGITRSECTTWADVTGKSKASNVCRARHRIWKLVRDECKLSYPAIAKLFGVDHSTVFAAIRNLEKKNE